MMRSIVRFGAGLATGLVVLTSVGGAQANNTPIVAVWPYIASGMTDISSLGGGLQELTIIDLANTAKVRVVERGRLNELMAEQNLVKTAAVDPATAVKLGKLWGVHYFISNSITIIGNQARVTARTTNVETGQVGNPQSLTESSNDIFGTINRLNAKMIAELKVTNLGGNAPAPAPAPTKGASASQQAVPAGAVAGKSATGKDILFKAPMPETVVKTTSTVTLDFKTALLYSKGIEALDIPDKKKAADLFKQVLAAEKDFGPAQEALKKTL
jgi:TolB-like protein